VFSKTIIWVLAAASMALQLAAQQTSQTGATAVDFQIGGTLVDANTGQPLQRARVAIASVMQRDDFATMTTGGDGRFLFTNLTPGKYTLSAQARGYLVQSFNQHEQFSSSITVGPNLDSNNLLFRLPPEGVISGVVTDEAGEPVRDAEVMLRITDSAGGAPASRIRGRITTDDEGAYHFNHLVPGRYQVAVITRPWYSQNQHRGGGLVSLVNPQDMIVVGTDMQGDAQLDVVYPVTFNGGVTDVAQASPIVLGRGEKFTVDINLQPVPALHVRIPKGDPEQPGYTSVELTVFETAVMGSRMGGFSQGGEEVISVAPGHYTLRHFPQGGNGGTETLQEVDINVSGEIDSSKASLRVPVSGKLQVDPGGAAGQVSVQLINKKSRQNITARMASDGEFMFVQGAPPGSYEVSIFSSSGIYVKTISASGAAVTGRTIEIRPGDGVKLAISTTVGQGQVKGTALRDGKPFAGAMIVLVPADPSHNQVLFRRDQSDSDGTFALSAVVPGAYTLLAIENGWDLEWLKPGVLKSYLAGGAAMQIGANGKYDVKVPVQ
jgi:hypothetical protein